MSITNLVRFNSICQFTGGLEDRWPGFQIVPDGIGLVTKFVAGEGWYGPALITTSWTDLYSTPTTTLTPLP